MEFWQFALIGIGAFLAGGVNALAGGGTLISFPLLTAMGMPAVVANITNTVALCPGYFGATIAQWKQIVEQKQRVLLFLPAAIAGGIVGGYLLLHTGERIFRELIPYLILLATLLLALGTPLRKWLDHKKTSGKIEIWIAIAGVLAILLAAIYGGYFGAGMSVILLAVLGVIANDSITNLNALKQLLALATNLAAAVFFVFSGNVNWPAALVMAVFALAGGAAGGRLAGKISATVLRWTVVGIGLAVSIYYFIN
jgi:uncharacterized membrane protein YfcA